MRDEEERIIERGRLFREFVEEEHLYRVASREAPPFDPDRMMQLDLRPWPETEPDGGEAV